MATTASGTVATWPTTTASTRASVAAAETPTRLVAAIGEAGIDRAVLQAEWAAGDYRAMNDAVHRIVTDHPDVLTGYVTVNPGVGDDMAAVVEHEVRERGARGVNLQPFSYRVLANDKRFYALYSKCQELGVPVTIHSSINFSNDRSIEFGRPLYLCEIACDFPDLIIVANHGGWPWVNELVAVAWKHASVYIEIGAVAPKYIGTPGTGWETLMQYGNSSLLSDRVLFATDNMIPFQRAIEELQDLPLKDHVKEGWLGGETPRGCSGRWRSGWRRCEQPVPPWRPSWRLTERRHRLPEIDGAREATHAYRHWRVAGQELPASTMLRLWPGTPTIATSRGTCETHFLTRTRCPMRMTGSVS